MTAIRVVDPLDYFFAALMLKVDIDVGRLPALLTDEALEQQVIAFRVN